MAPKYNSPSTPTLKTPTRDDTIKARPVNSRGTNFSIVVPKLKFPIKALLNNCVYTSKGFSPINAITIPLNTMQTIIENKTLRYLLFIIFLYNIFFFTSGH